MQFCRLKFFEASPQDPPKWGPKKLIFLIVQVRVIVFCLQFIGRYLSNK